MSLLYQGKDAEAEPGSKVPLHEVHPSTLTSVHNLAVSLYRQGKYADAERIHREVLEVRKRVLVAKPEHNGKRAPVLSFDARTGRYAVSLEDGKELSLKAECVARAGCAAAGCASEEASSMCGRCEAVRYCSRECQRADWKAHKGACAAAQSGARRELGGGGVDR